MGQLLDELGRDSVQEAKATLKDLKVQVNRTANTLVTLAARFRSVQDVAEDDEDAAELAKRLGEAVAGAKAIVDAADPEVKAIVVSALTGIIHGLS